MPFLQRAIRRTFRSIPKASLHLEGLESRDMLSGNPLLPDLIGLASQSHGYIYGWTLDRTTMPGHVLLRLTTTEANVGAGPFEIRGGPVNPDGTQQVFQRVYNDDGTFTDHLAGNFVYHPTHHHIHFDDIAQYNLRARPADNSVGDVVAAGAKTSFCLIDIDHFNASLPHSPANSVYNSCGSVLQGVSVGWADVYSSGLDDQWIDVTGVPDGNYWLEDVLDPNNRILEADETNNVTRIPITLGGVSAAGPLILSSEPWGITTAPVSSVQVTFNHAINISTFTAADVAFSGPAGTIRATGVTPVTGSGDTQFTITFAAQSAAGSYRMLIGPNIQDKAGRLMDQNQDGIGGQGKGDRYAASFTLAPPMITGTAPVLNSSGAVVALRVTFNAAIDPHTFTPSTVTHFTDPKGQAIAVTGVTAVAGTDNFQFDVTFAPETTAGTYTMLIGGTILDSHGNRVNKGKPFTATFTISRTGAVSNASPSSGYGNMDPAVLDKLYGTTTF